MSVPVVSPVVYKGIGDEPTADMPVPEGHEVNLNGDQVQGWCGERQKAGQRDLQHLKFDLGNTTVLVRCSRSRGIGLGWVGQMQAALGFWK